MVALLFHVVIILLVAGFLAWIVGKLPFIQPALRQIVQGVILFVALIILLYAVYDAHSGGGGRLPAHGW